MAFVPGQSPSARVGAVVCGRGLQGSVPGQSPSAREAAKKQAAKEERRWRRRVLVDELFALGQLPSDARTPSVEARIAELVAIIDGHGGGGQGGPRADHVLAGCLCGQEPGSVRLVLGVLFFPRQLVSVGGHRMDPTPTSLVLQYFPRFS